MNEEPYIGAIDNQTEEQKAKNYTLSEVVSAPTPVIWIEKPRSAYRSFPIRNQDGSSTCVCQTYANEISILLNQKYGEWVDFSSSFPYQQRSQPAYGGCNSVDLYSVFPKIGDVYESLMPSQNMNEETVMAVKRPAYLADLAKTYKLMRISIPIDFETVASTIQATGKGVMVWFRFSHEEWLTTPVVLPQPTTSGHSVTAIDFTLINGKKFLVIQDSWGLAYADQGLRYISEEYFNARCFLASYIKTFEVQNNDTVAFKPTFDGTIVSAQKCFKYEGFYPANFNEVENWGPVTRGACIKFQQKYNILPALGNFGPLTHQKLAELYK